MIGTHDLQVVVPVYNEGKNFPRFFKSLEVHVKTPHDLLVVYDFDEDDTIPVVREIMTSCPNVHLVRNGGRGVLGALKTGFAVVSGGAVLVTMADCSDDHSCVDLMYAKYQAGCSVVSASRYSEGGAQEGGPIVKGLLSRFAGLTLHLLAKVRTKDPTNNFKLYDREFLKAVTIESNGGFELALELTIKAHRAGYRVCEVPTIWKDRVAGESRFKLIKWLPRYLRWYLLAFSPRTRDQAR